MLFISWPLYPQKCLAAAGWNPDAAYDLLRKKGLAAAAKKASRQATEGLVGVASKGGLAALVEINSETDFVARNELFTKLVSQVSQAALQINPSAAAPGTAEVPIEQVGCSPRACQLSSCDGSGIV